MSGLLVIFEKLFGSSLGLQWSILLLLFTLKLMGQTEVVKCSLSDFLKFLVGEKPGT